MPGYEPWLVARWAMTILLDQASKHAKFDDDREAIAQAFALDGLHFGLLPNAQARAVAAAVEVAADELRRSLKREADPLDREFAERLGDLSLQLSDLSAT